MSAPQRPACAARKARTMGHQLRRVGPESSSPAVHVAAAETGVARTIPNIAVSWDWIPHPRPKAIRKSISGPDEFHRRLRPPNAYWFDGSLTFTPPNRSPHRRAAPHPVLEYTSEQPFRLNLLHMTPGCHDGGEGFVRKRSPLRGARSARSRPGAPAPSQQKCSIQAWTERSEPAGMLDPDLERGHQASTSARSKRGVLLRPSQRARSKNGATAPSQQECLLQTWSNYSEPENAAEPSRAPSEQPAVACSTASSPLRASPPGLSCMRLTASGLSCQ